MRDKILNSTVRRVLLEQAGALKVARVDTQEPMSVDIGQEVTLRGMGFSSGMQVSLTSPRGKRVAAEKVTVSNPGAATVYVPGLPETGSYKIEVAAGNMRSELMDALTVGMRKGGPT